MLVLTIIILNALHKLKSTEKATMSCLGFFIRKTKIQFIFSQSVYDIISSVSLSFVLPPWICFCLWRDCHSSSPRLTCFFLQCFSTSLPVLSLLHKKWKNEMKIMESVISSLPPKQVVWFVLASKIKHLGHDSDPANTATAKALAIIALPIWLCGALWEGLRCYVMLSLKSWPFFLNAVFHITVNLKNIYVSAQFS